MKMTWTLEQSLKLCKALEPIAARHGAHVGLTGGTLYKEGERKDADLILYPHGNGDMDFVAMFDAMQGEFGISVADHPRGRVWKATTKSGKPIDFMILESSSFYPDEEHL